MKTQKPAPKTPPTIIVTLKKMPKAGELAPQAEAICASLKAAKGGALAVADLKTAMKGRVKTKQTIGRIWLYYRDRLVKDGYVAVKGGK